MKNARSTFFACLICCGCSLLFPSIGCGFGIGQFQEMRRTHDFTEKHGIDELTRESFYEYEAEYDTQVKKYEEILEQARTDLSKSSRKLKLGNAKQRELLNKHHPKPRDYLPIFLAIAKKFPATTEAAKSLLWVLPHVYGGDRVRMLETLSAEHISMEE